MRCGVLYAHLFLPSVCHLVVWVYRRRWIPNQDYCLADEAQVLLAQVLLLQVLGKQVIRHVNLQLR